MKKSDKKKTILTDDELEQRARELVAECKKAGAVCTYLAARDDEKKPLTQIALNGTRADIEALICIGIVRLAKVTHSSVGYVLGDIIMALTDTKVDD